MSDNTNKSDVLMQPIVIPTIGDAGYADSLNEAFDTINKNFVKLSNHDFVKGDAGVSVKIADYKNVGTIEGIDIPGVYIINAVNKNNVKYCRLIVK